LKISTRLSLAVYIPALMALVVLVALFFSYQEMGRIRNDGDTVRKIRTSITELNHFAFSYVLYHEERPKQQFLAEHDNLTGLIGSTQLPTPEQQLLLNSIRENSVAMKDMFLQLVSTVDRGSAASMNDLQGAEDRLVGLLLLNSYQADSDAAALRSVVDDGIRVTETRTIGLIFLVMLLTTIPLTIVLIRTKRGINSSISNLAKGTVVIGSGNLDYLIEAKTKDEIGELSRAFNGMTANLKTITASKKELEKEIAERKQAEDALFKSEQRWATTLGSIGDAVIATDTSGKVTYMNAQAEALTGWTLREADSKSVAEIFNIINEHTRQQVESPVDKVLKQGIICGLANHTILLRKDGTEVAIDDSGAPIRTQEGNTTGVVLVFRDITDRKKAEEALKESEAKATAMIRYAPTAIYEIDYRGPRFISMNDAMCYLSGYTREELFAINPSDLLDGDSQKRFADRIRRMLAGEKIDDSVEYKIKKKDGSFIYVTLNVSLSQDKPHTAFVIGHDITERKGAEESLRQSEEKYRSLNFSMNEGVSLHEIICDNKGKAVDYRILDVNPAYEIITGLNKENVVGKNASQLYGTGLPPYLDIYERVAASGKAESFETYFPPMEKHFSISVFSPGKGMFATIFTNITKRKKDEEAIQNTLSRLYSILTEMPLGVLLVTAEGMGELANQPFCDMFKLKQSPASLKDLSASEIVETIKNNYLYPEKAIARINEIVDKLKPVKDEEVPMSDGRTFLRDFVPIHLGEKSFGRLWIHRDISERKKAEEELKASEEKYKSLTENIPDIVTRYDRNLRHVYANTAASRATGLPVEAFIGKTNLELGMELEQVEFWMNHVQKVFETGKPDTMDFAFQAPDGLQFQQTIITPEFDVDGSVKTVLCITRNLTELKKAEEALKESAANLKRYNTELEAANKELETFSYSVSHDLRQPLRTLDGFSEMVIEEYGDKLDEVGKDYLNRIRKAGQTMSQLTDDILKLSRITRAQIHTEKINLSDIARSITDELKSTQPERRAEIIIGPDITVNGDKQLLPILMRNLLENSWKYTSKCPNTIIEFGTLNKDEKRVYFIRDNGIGFNMQYKDKLFQPFQRLHASKDYPGTGIGLATSQRVIYRHGGKIWAESEIGKGATFYFTLDSEAG
jgi:PAS domain S-box-containing protein